MLKTKPSKEPLLHLETDEADAAPPEERRKPRQKPLLSAEIAHGGAASDVPRGDEEGEEGRREAKQGHKMFFLCCDTKRAVVWLNTLVLLLNVFTLTGALVQTERARAAGYTQAMIVRGCGMFVTLTTIFGAYTYSKGVVLVGLLFACYQLTVATLNATKYNWGGGDNDEGKLEVLLPVLWNALLFYAEGTFISEVNDGIMTQETYKSREKYICCCSW